MISSLSIRNLALIENINVTFKKGFSVFTGETGAGKSILLGAIGLLLGDRASSESIRSGFDEAEINASFELEKISPALEVILKDASLNISDDLLIIRRTIQKNGRNKVFINQIPVPLTTLKQIGDHLIDLHGQHDHQLLLKSESANIIINELEGVKAPFVNFQKEFSVYKETLDKLKNFEKEANALEQKKELLEFQYTELSKLELKHGEEEELEEEFKLLSSRSDRMESAKNILSSLNGDSGEDSVSRKLSKIENELRSLSKNDPSASDWLNDLENTFTFISELENFCEAYLSDSGTEEDAGRLEYLNSRLASIQRMKKKYNCDFTGLIEKTADLKRDLDSIENRDAERQFLQRQVNQKFSEAMKAAEILTKARINSASQFDAAITNEMSRLGFSSGAIKTAFTEVENLSINGMEEIHFEVRTNAGEPFRSLTKTASGGEISRIMLAIKTVLNSSESVPTLIFDEIDTGIGGKLAIEVAKSLYSLSLDHQVLCISHLHQIASKADNHYSIYKHEVDGRTVTEINELDKKDRIDEISRMLGGDSEAARKHAEELLA